MPVEKEQSLNYLLDVNVMSAEEGHRTSYQLHIAFNTKFQLSASTPSLEQPLSICPISFNLIPVSYTHLTLPTTCGV